MSEERESFLSRWSKRKLEERLPERKEPEPGTEPELDAAAAPRPAAAAEPELTPEEIEALPNVEDLTADSDLTVFLRKGVPEALKKAALRRMWMLDPAIRDFVGEARDYSYDWNVPGGVPGNGPLLPGDDVDGLLRQVLGRDGGTKAQEGTPEQVASSQAGERMSLAEPDASAPPDQTSAAVPQDPGRAAEADDPESQSPQAIPASGPIPDPVASHSHEPGEMSPVRTIRRHGRAKPL
jgi:hypothetical protein